MRYISSLTAACLIFAGCAKVQESAGTASPPTIDYAALQKAAEAFVPSVGKRGGEIILSTFSDPKSFNPITSTETSTSEFTSLMYEGLVRINGVTSLPEPNLAEAWEVSADGLTWTFHIRRGVRWSDGTPFSAYDVDFTFNNLIFNDGINPNSSRDVFTVENKRMTVTALDSLTVRFILPQPYAPFLRAMSQEILPKHRYSGLVTRGVFSTSLGISTHPDSMVGTGPFLLESYISSQKLTFKRNPFYWKKDSAGQPLPYLDRVVYLIVLDQNAELLRFKRGEIDYLAAKGEDYPSLKKYEAQGGYTVYRLGPSAGSSFLFFNLNTGSDPRSGKPYVDPVKLSWFRNELFRKAVAHAIDKQSMINIVMNGLGYEQWSPMAPSEGYFYCDSVRRYPYNLDTARALLAQAGFFDRNGDGVIDDTAGHPVEFSLITNSGNNVRVKIAEIIRKDLQTLGFKVHFQQLEFNTLVQKIDNPPFDWDAVLLGLTGGPEPHFGKNVWHSSGTLHMWFPRQQKPSTPWEARIDSIFDAGVKELDPRKRKALYDQWQQLAAEHLPLIYTVLSERILCLSNKFRNVNPSPSVYGGLLHNIEYIYIK